MIRVFYHSVDTLNFIFSVCFKGWFTDSHDTCFYHSVDCQNFIFSVCFKSGFTDGHDTCFYHSVDVQNFTFSVCFKGWFTDRRDTCFTIVHVQIGCNWTDWLKTGPAGNQRAS